jgi:hypothetical protein
VVHYTSVQIFLLSSLLVVESDDHDDEAENVDRLLQQRADPLKDRTQALLL